MATLNAGRTIDHSAKSNDANQIGIPSYQHGKPYMLPGSRPPKSITYRNQQNISVQQNVRMLNQKPEGRDDALRQTILLEIAVQNISKRDTLND